MVEFLETSNEIICYAYKFYVTSPKYFKLKTPQINVKLYTINESYETFLWLLNIFLFHTIYSINNSAK